MMDSSQEKLQSLGYLGMFKESFKIMFSWKKIFTQITLSLILPFALIYLIHIQVSDYLLLKISNDENSQDAHASDALRSDYLTYCAIQIAYIVCIQVLSLLCTPVIAYTTTCMYTGEEITYMKVIKVVPRVWKRLMVTFFWIIALTVVYGILGSGFYVLCVFWLGFTPVGIVIGVILFVLYLAGFTYFIVICNLASVVPVLEEIYGIGAMLKSMDLIKGKTKAIIGIRLTLNLINVGINILFKLFLMHLMRCHKITVMVPLTIGIVCFFLLLCLYLLFTFVIQTVTYFVCKSYHGESINNMSMVGHLGAYPIDYAPLKEATAMDAQLEQV